MNTIILAVLLLQQVYAPADFTQVSGGSLKARYDSAIAQAGRASDDAFWIAYRFPVRKDVRIVARDNNLQITSTTSSDGIEWIPDATDQQRIAIFLMIGKSDKLIRSTRLIDLNQNFRVHDRKVYWLGEPAADESLNLLDSFALDAQQQKNTSSLFHYMSLHDSPNVASHLLQVARDASKPTEVRRNAINYLGRQVSQQAAQELEKLSEDPSTEIQNAAVQAIARRPDDESIPTLIRIAKDHPRQTVRQQAIRSLSNKKDPRVVDFFEQVLKKK